MHKSLLDRASLGYFLGRRLQAVVKRARGLKMIPAISRGIPGTNQCHNKGGNGFVRALKT
jgi:hypothetical protein